MNGKKRRVRNIVNLFLFIGIKIEIKMTVFLLYGVKTLQLGYP
jgi:hypothetical protein